MRGRFASHLMISCRKPHIVGVRRRPIQHKTLVYKVLWNAPNCLDAICPRYVPGGTCRAILEVERRTGLS